MSLQKLTGFNIMTFIISFLLMALSVNMAAEPVVVPEPQQIIYTQDRFSLAGKTTVITGRQHLHSAQMVQEFLQEYAGIDCLIAETGKQISGNRIRLEKIDYGSEESYELHVASHEMVIRYHSDDSLFYALQTLSQLIEKTGRGDYVRNCEIKDYPDLAFRGTLLVLTRCTADEKTMQGLKRLIDMQARLKQNKLLVEFGGNLRYDSRRFPGREKTAFSKAQVSELIDYAKQRHIDIIPAFQMFSHCTWILDNKDHIAFLEDRSVTSWGATWCPSNPEVYEFIDDILEETIDLFKPEYCLVGLDEIGAIGRCERCRGQDPSQLFLKMISYLHGRLRARNVRTIMWHDMLLPPELGQKNPVNGYRIIDSIPRDMVIAYWDYGVFDERSQKRLAYFLDRKFTVLGASFAKPLGISTLNKALTGRKNCLGHIGTHWYEVSDWGNPGRRSPDSWVSQLLGAQYSWNSRRPEIQDIAYDPVAVAHQIYDPHLKKNTPLRWQMISLKRYFNHIIDATSGSWPGYGVKNSLSSIFEADIPLFELGEKGKKNAVVLQGDRHDRFSKAKSVTVAMEKKVKKLAFLHACNISDDHEYLNSWKGATAMPAVGTYRINYADGTFHEIPLRYRWNIMDWNGRTSAYACSLAYVGKTPGKARIQLVKLVIENPCPEKKIVSVQVRSDGKAGMSIALFALSVAN